MKKIMAVILAIILIFNSENIVRTKNKEMVNAKQPNTIELNSNIVDAEILVDNNKNSITPSGLFFEKDGTLVITDLYNKTVWSQKDNIEKKIIGNANVIYENGIPIGGYRDGTLNEALFESPWAIAPYLDGYAITDTNNHVVRFSDSKEVSTLASMNRPTGLAADGKGNLYVADTGKHVIYKIDVNKKVTRYAGSKKGCSNGTCLSACLNEPTGLYFADGILYVADSGNHRICKIEKNKVVTVAGTTYKKGSDGYYQGGYVDGSTKVAQFASPQGIAVLGKVIYVADTGNSVIRKIEKGKVQTLFKRTEKNELYPIMPRSIVVFDKKLFISDAFANKVFTISTDVKK